MTELSDRDLGEIIEEDQQCNIEQNLKVMEKAQEGTENRKHTNLCHVEKERSRTM